MKYVSWILIVLILAGLVTLFVRQNDSLELEESAVTSEQGAEMFVFEETEFDFGVIKQSEGVVKHTFPFTYVGTEDVEVVGVPTSCGCTSAEIDNSSMTNGSQGVITVTFDPNLHAEPDGRFYKTITLITEPAVENAVELKIWVEIDLDLGEEFFILSTHEGEALLESGNISPDKAYKTISAETLTEALDDKHFYLVDVHTPLQEHIEKTDAVIAFDELEERQDELPQDKDEKIVLYCRSGGMSQQAAQTLVDLGYTDVYHLEGGINAFNALNE